MDDVPSPPPIDTSDEAEAALLALSGRFEALGNSIQAAVRERPLEGTPASPWHADCSNAALGSATLLTLGAPGVLALLQSCRGNARALQVLYRSLGPAVGDPAPLDLMRGIWERSALLLWLLDRSVDSDERLGRMKGWLEDGLKKEHLTTPLRSADFTAAIQELDEIPLKSRAKPNYVDLARAQGGERTYRRLSGLIHGRVWTASAAVVSSDIHEGTAFAWRGFPLALHEMLSYSTVEVAERAAQAHLDYVADVEF